MVEGTYSQANADGGPENKKALKYNVGGIHIGRTARLSLPSLLACPPCSSLRPSFPRTEPPYQQGIRIRRGEAMWCLKVLGLTITPVTCSLSYFFFQVPPSLCLPAKMGAPSGPLPSSLGPPTTSTITLHFLSKHPASIRHTLFLTLTPSIPSLRCSSPVSQAPLPKPLAPDAPRRAPAHSMERGRVSHSGLNL